MNFIDHLVVSIHAGNGGDGIVCFEKGIRAEKRPSGGNGGSGGDIIIIGDLNLSSLDHLRNNQVICANSGGNGSTNNKNGSHGDHKIIKVPFGTTIKDLDNQVLCFISRLHPKFTIAHGGKGGHGNSAFLNNHNRIPFNYETGEIGDQFKIKIEMQIIADVGIIGWPTVGKTTFLNTLSSTKYSVGVYDFTTLIPNLGVVSYDDHIYKFCDVPGIIKGAHLNKGLGFYFLKHVALCKIFLYMIRLDDDINAAIRQYFVVQTELKKYDPDLLRKPNLIIINYYNNNYYQSNKKMIQSTIFEKLNLKNKSFYYNLLDELNDFKALFQVIDQSLIINTSDRSLRSYYSGINSKIINIKAIDTHVLVKKIKNNEFEISGEMINHLTTKFPLTNKDNFNLLIKHLKNFKLLKFLRKKNVKNLDYLWVNDQKFLFHY